MSFSQSKFYKPALVGLCVVLLLGVSQIQKSMNVDREKFGITKMPPLENAPPVLAFTTVALGGFRGIVANALWLRANELQDEDKYFEMVQLADWITKLEPHFVQVWLIQAWNMAYNVSVKFKDPQDRWRWVQRGISLLRDEGLRLNPDETLMYRELSWFFQHKMGQNLDDAHMTYKQEWFYEMSRVLGRKPNYDELLNPKTEEAAQRVATLRDRYKMDPKIMKDLDDRYGPLEWRLPDAHAVYWAEVGRQRAKKEDQERLQRSIYQTMQMSFRRGAIYENKLDTNSFSLGPNLDNIAHVNETYEELMRAPDPEHRDQPVTGHRNFLKDVVYFMYMYNRHTDARKWLAYLNEKYPNAIRDYMKSRNMAVPEGAEVPINEYVVARITEDVSETDVDRIVAIVGGYLQQAMVEMATGDDDRAAHFASLADRIWKRFQGEIKGIEGRIAPPPIEEIRQRVIDELLNPDPEVGLPPEFAATLRTKLGLPPPTSPEKPASQP